MMFVTRRQYIHITEKLTRLYQNAGELLLIGNILTDAHLKYGIRALESIGNIF